MVQQQQHSKLMDEFKLAHKKMFKSGETPISKPNTVIGKETMASSNILNVNFYN